MRGHCPEISKIIIRQIPQSFFSGQNLTYQGIYSLFIRKIIEIPVGIYYIAICIHLNSEEGKLYICIFVYSTPFGTTIFILSHRNRGHAFYHLHAVGKDTAMGETKYQSEDHKKHYGHYDHGYDHESDSQFFYHLHKKSLLQFKMIPETSCSNDIDIGTDGLQFLSEKSYIYFNMIFHRIGIIAPYFT